MVANVHGPQFSGGANIAIKCPSHTYEQTIRFYRDTLGLPLIEARSLGLSIVVELARLYGGVLTLGTAPIGRLRAELALPGG